jgi:RimJ/RimL family protein N-acetyltransferase
MRGLVTTFSRSEDYALIRDILTDARCWRRMTKEEPGSLSGFMPGPTHGRIAYIVAREGAAAAAVFLIVDGLEIHFCFRPRTWGRTEPIARAFLEWVWRETDATRLVGPVPKHNRLALRLARAAGFTEFAATVDHVLLEIRKP